MHYLQLMYKHSIIRYNKTRLTLLQIMIIYLECQKNGLTLEEIQLKIKMQILI